MKTGVVDVGGGLRGVYAAGVLDHCLDAGIRFDVGVGVSAGSANIVSYAGGQRGRNYRFYTEYSFRREYMGVKNFLFKRSLLDLDYIYGTLSISGGEDPLNYAGIVENPMELAIVATNAETGQARYFGKSDLHQDDYNVLKASSALPFLCHPYQVEGTAYYDGALGDTIPLGKAFSMGCDRVVLILTKPADLLRVPGRDPDFARGIQKRYPYSAQRLRQRARQYNDGVALAKKLAAQGRVCIIAPDDTCGVDTLTRDKTALRRLYEKGLRDGGRIDTFLAGAAKAPADDEVNR